MKIKIELIVCEGKKKNRLLKILQVTFYSSYFIFNHIKNTFR